jgi:hypothetical protein
MITLGFFDVLFYLINLDHKSIQEGIIYLFRWIACVSCFAVFDILLAKISLWLAFLFCRCHKPPPQIVGEDYAFFNLFTCVGILLLPKKRGGRRGWPGWLVLLCCCKVGSHPNILFNLSKKTQVLSLWLCTNIFDIQVLIT